MPGFQHDLLQMFVTCRARDHHLPEDSSDNTSYMNDVLRQKALLITRTLRITRFIYVSNVGCPAILKMS